MEHETCSTGFLKAFWFLWWHKSWE